MCCSTVGIYTVCVLLWGCAVKTVVINKDFWLLGFFSPCWNRKCQLESCFYPFQISGSFLFVWFLSYSLFPLSQSKTLITSEFNSPSPLISALSLVSLSHLLHHMVLWVSDTSHGLTEPAAAFFINRSAICKCPIYEF